MLLPYDPKTPWPPPPWDKVQDRITEYAAWYSGDPNGLMNYYGHLQPSNRGIDFYGNRPSQYRGGVVGTLSRMWWGAPIPTGNSQTARLHIPLAEEIAAEGGYQLFKNPPRIEIEESVYGDRLEKYISWGLFAKLLTAAEVASALTGVYLAVTYDEEVANKPLMQIIHPDAAIPTFRYGILQDVIFWRTLEDDGGVVIRHLERHSKGYIEQALYKGDRRTIGSTISLESSPVTAGLQPTNETGLPRLNVVYVPNLSTRIWRDGGQPSNLGRSDFGSPGVLTLLDALDETYTSLQRDIRLGKSRIFVAQGSLETHGKGNPAYYDLEREVYVELDVLGGSDDKLNVQPQQFEIRFAAHHSAANDYTERIISGSGYSAQTFGLQGDVAMTATESDSRWRRTINTRAAKISAWQQALPELIELHFMVDSILGNVPKPPDEMVMAVEFPPAVVHSPKDVAETIKLLREARAASNEILIKMQHPEWDETRVEQEVGTINAEYLDTV